MKTFKSVSLFVAMLGMLVMDVGAQPATPPAATPPKAITPPAAPSPVATPPVTTPPAAATPPASATPPATQPGAAPAVAAPDKSSPASNQKPYIDDKLIVIGTGAITGVYYPAGGAICRLVNRERKVKCAVESTQGSIYNLNALRNAEIDLAIVQSDWQEHAFNGTADFTKTGRMDNLRFLFSLHDEAFTVVVSKKSNITKFDDIKGKIINIGPEGSGVRSTMAEVMKAKNWSNTDFKSLTEFKSTEQAKALCEGRIDVMLLISGHPNGANQEITEMCEVRLVEVNDPEIQKLIQNNPEYSAVIIPGGIYPGIPMDTKTFAIKATVVATTDLSDQIAYNVTKLVFDNILAFRTFHPVFAQLTVEKMATEGRSAPYHNGALKYFKEKGLVK